MEETKSLYAWIEGLAEEEYNYYASEANNDPLAKPFVTGVSAVEFILRYFDKGGKKMITDGFEADTFGTPRAEHTVSIFFLGVLLYNNTALRNHVFYNGRINTRFDFFAFIWFISCLAHDFAFYRERKTDGTDNLQLWERLPTIEKLIEEKEIAYNLLETQPGQVPGDLFRLVAPYFLKRHAEGRTDHGIFAGLLAYDLLVKNRQYQKSIHNIQWLWEDYLDQEYAYAAATIAVHNIWLPAEKDHEQYQKNGLGALISHDPFTFKDGPLYYLLSIVDTLDPFKAYSNEKDENPLPIRFVLDHVHLRFISDRCFELTVTSPLEADVLHTKAKNAHQFLSIRTSDLPDGIQVELLL